MRLFTSILFVLYFQVLTAQLNKPHIVSLSSKSGFLIAHRPFMSHLVQKKSWCFEVTAWRQMNGNDDITKRLRTPLKGLSVEARNFGYNAVLGHAFSVTGYMGFPLMKTKKAFYLDLIIGTGIGYLTKHYDVTTNPLNNAIGSHLNGRVNLKLIASKYFRRWHIGGGIEFMHFSNGSITTPNLGLNSPSLFINTGYNINERLNPAPRSEIEKNPLPQAHALTIELIGSAKEIGAIPYFPKRYPVIAARAGYSYTKNGLWGVDIALDLIHNEANFHKYTDTSFTRSDILQAGIYLGTFLRFYNTQLAFGLGYYVRDNINPEGRLYNRIGYRHYFNKKWFALFNIKANYAKADYFEFGIGYRFLSW